jgi:cytochrome c553
MPHSVRRFGSASKPFAYFDLWKKRLRGVRVFVHSAFIRYLYRTIGGFMNSAFLWLIGMSLLVLSQTQVTANDQSSKKTASSKSSASPKVSSSPMHVQQKYIAYCTHCHGMDGRPTALVERVMPEIPDFSRMPWGDYDKQDVIASIADGTGQMPGFSKVLTKIEMDALAVMITKFPSGKPFSLIEKSSRYRKADRRLVEVFIELEDELR